MCMDMCIDMHMLAVDKLTSCRVLGWFACVHVHVLVSVRVLRVCVRVYRHVSRHVYRHVRTHTHTRVRGGV